MTHIITFIRNEQSFSWSNCILELQKIISCEDLLAQIMYTDIFTLACFYLNFPFWSTGNFLPPTTCIFWLPLDNGIFVLTISKFFYWKLASHQCMSCGWPSHACLWMPSKDFFWIFLLLNFSLHQFWQIFSYRPRNENPCPSNNQK